MLLSMATTNLSSTSPQTSLYACFSCSLNPSSRRYSPHSVLLPHTPPSYNTLVFQAAKLLGPPATFDASKLQVLFKGEETDQYTRIVPRTYKLSHCDFTANLTLTISNIIDHHQLKGWYNKDDVVAQWAEVKGHMCLDVHCYVSGPNSLLDLAAEFRYYIFSKELPLVLEAVLYGDRVLFSEHKELMDAFVRVFFHSSSKKYNRVECWGPLKDAAKGQVGYQIQDQLAGKMERSVPPKNEGIPKSVFQALCTFLL
ncbi:protein STAY-GREEN LIKE, chloroplastic isoform X2 [Cynara cardunculus var. scolymus]|uniref:protein STAY-GREEN LIKE, chloroplastic isoform X2 n=1 Tax=Cynara cardunculus var. scolymus TaxID=59895 RepID=UPI000D627105|nr:protein STAY-GREEN LIKE, chloroplastic isoform X2 [Cynara cardunculus var. scolymus]